MTVIQNNINNTILGKYFIHTSAVLYLNKNEGNRLSSPQQEPKAAEQKDKLNDLNNKNSGLFMFLSFGMIGTIGRSGSSIINKIPNWVKFLFKFLVLSVFVLKLLGFNSIFDFLNNTYYLKIFIYISVVFAIILQLLDILLVYLIL